MTVNDARSGLWEKAVDEDLLGPRKAAGRPSFPSSLQTLLVQAIPPNVPAVAAALDLTEVSVYRWIRRNSIPPKQAARIVDLSEGRVTLSDFFGYIFL